MSAKKRESVPRPVKTTEYTIVFGTAQARKGWQDIVAVQRNAAALAWDVLTQAPLTDNERCHPLKGSLEHVTYHGEKHVRRQYELTGGAWIWFYVSGSEVVLIDVHTHHPNQTK
jgi:hypothetical protein